MWTIHADCRISRRKSLSHVLDNRDTMLFSSSSAATCLQWCFEQGEYEVGIVTEDFSMVVRHQPIVT